MKLSVIVPVHNGASFIGALLDSLARQDHGASDPPEFIVVDDASTDATANILAQYPWVRTHRHSAQRGAGAARNTGARIAAGDVLIFLDADTRVREADFLARCVAVLEEHSECASFSGCYYDSNPARSRFCAYLDAAEAEMRRGTIDRLAPGGLNGCVCGVRRHAFEAANGFSEDRRVTLEDVDLGFRLGKAGYQHWFSGSLRVEHQQPGLRDYVKELVPRTRHYLRLIRRDGTFSDVMGGRSEGLKRAVFLIGLALLATAAIYPAAGATGAALLSISALRGHRFISRLCQTAPARYLPLAFGYHTITSAALVVGGTLGIFDAIRFKAHSRIVDLAMFGAYLRSLMTRHGGGYLIHFLTHRCNAHCAHCFDDPQRQRIGKQQELSLPRIRRLAASTGPLGHVSLTGGEPTLRSDIDEIMTAYYAAGVRSFSLASNGSTPERLAELLPRLTRTAPTARIIIKLSVDGIGAEHDALRGVPGLYQKVEESIAIVSAARDWAPQLRLHICLTLSQANANRFQATLDTVHALGPDQIELNRVRGITANPTLCGISDDTYDAACRHLAAISGGTRGLTRLLTRLDQAMRTIVRRPERPWPCGPCLAGRKLVVIQADGTVLPCEMLRTVRAKDAPAYGDFVLGRLDAHQDDLNALLASPQARRITDYISQTGCRCSFECAILATISYRPWRAWRFLTPTATAPEST